MSHNHPKADGLALLLIKSFFRRVTTCADPIGAASKVSSKSNSCIFATLFSLLCCHGEQKNIKFADSPNSMRRLNHWLSLVLDKSALQRSAVRHVVLFEYPNICFALVIAWYVIKVDRSPISSEERPLFTSEEIILFRPSSSGCVFMYSTNCSCLLVCQIIKRI